MKYKPKTYSELSDLVWDFNIYLGDIDTSEIDDMNYFLTVKEKIILA